MNSFSTGPDGERGVNLPEQANARVELGLRTDLRISPHKRTSLEDSGSRQIAEVRIERLAGKIWFRSGHRQSGSNLENRVASE